MKNVRSWRKGIERERGAAEVSNRRPARSSPEYRSEEELRSFEGPVTVFASEEDVFFPAGAVLSRAGERKQEDPTERRKR